MKRKSYYKVVCDPINLVLLIRKLGLEEEQKAYFKLKHKISTLEEPITIESYMVYVLKSFLHKSEEFFSNLPPDEDKLTIVKAVYRSIIEAYPIFDLNFVCADINNGEFIEGVGDSMRLMFEDIGAAQANPSRNTLKSLSSKRDITSLVSYFDKNLVGQKEAVKSLVDSMKLIATGLYKTASFFFVGPTGVGKTEAAKLLGSRYSGNFWKLNCAEYALPHEYNKLIGSPPGYVGHTEKSLIAEKAEKSNRWVILFDEIEKAHPKFYDFLLSMLDDGTCTDNMGKVIDFSESIFIFTSNQGLSDIGRGYRLGFANEKISVSGCREEITESVRKKFPTEFMNRIDNFIFFNTLTPSDVRKIATLNLKHIPLKRTRPLLNYVAKNGYSEEYGARNIKRFIKNEIAVPVAQIILDKKEPQKEGDLYTPKIVNNEFTITNLRDGDLSTSSAE